MAQCYFCKRKFENRQGVRAHLRACEIYRNRDDRSKDGFQKRKAIPIGRSAYKENLPDAELYDPALPARRHLITEEVRDKFFTLTEHGIPQPDHKDIGLRTDNLLDRPFLNDLEESERRERVKRARVETGKRHAKGRLKGEVSLGLWDQYLASLEVEKALKNELTGDESAAEAEQIAESALAPWKEKAERKRRDQKQKESEKLRQERKRELIRFGKTYALEIAEEEGLSSWNKIIFLSNVQQEMEKSLDGKESEDVVEELVEELLLEEDN